MDESPSTIGRLLDDRKVQTTARHAYLVGDSAEAAAERVSDSFAADPETVPDEASN